VGGTCKEIESYPIIIGGEKDHEHLLVFLSRKMAFLKKQVIEYNERYACD